MKTPFALAAAVLLTLTSAAFALPRAGETMQEAATLRYVAANSRMSAFVGEVSGAPIRATTVWLFFKTPESEKGEPFDIAVSEVQIDCVARAIKRSSVLAVDSGWSGAGAANRVVAAEPIEEAFTAYDPRSIFGAALAAVCDGSTSITTEAPVFSTVAKARAFGLSMTGR